MHWLLFERRQWNKNKKGFPTQFWKILRVKIHLMIFLLHKYICVKKNYSKFLHWTWKLSICIFFFHFCCSFFIYVYSSQQCRKYTRIWRFFDIKYYLFFKELVLLLASFIWSLLCSLLFPQPFSFFKFQCLNDSHYSIFLFSFDFLFTTEFFSPIYTYSIRCVLFLL